MLINLVRRLYRDNQGFPYLNSIFRNQNGSTLIIKVLNSKTKQTYFSLEMLRKRRSTNQSKQNTSSKKTFHMALFSRFG